ncbi:BadF/BadG/BcrA/BcrD ATPase family protein [Streptomyces sp. NBC_00239]|uniref:BadF/BadG/BcrA/BcrD ATPase family protein n=1 Tax=Streptomyces sp. NBC_00239 TaxID=2903640 RepID=UPI002E2D8CF9|nr:BadF/BadG/BcrA/BcrD ATPase family protein [Streptomyces sp. NBC_00239]
MDRMRRIDHDDRIGHTDRPDRIGHTDRPDRMDRLGGAAAGWAAGPVWVAGVDVGGTGVRVALARLDGDGGGPAVVARTDIAAATRTGPGGIDARALLDTLLPACGRLLAETGAPAVRTLAVGATGMVALGRDLAARLPGPLARITGAERLVLASDAVCAYAGALGARPGVVVAAGTGMIALGTDLATGWRRADGWGHLLGDCGGGAWIGRAALDAALRAHDGRDGGSAPLLARVTDRFGPPAGLPAVFQGSDRAALLASIAPDVGEAAAADPVAAGILARAAAEIAGTAAAVASAVTRPDSDSGPGSGADSGPGSGADSGPGSGGGPGADPGAGPRIALTGRLFELAGLRAAVADRLTDAVPGVRLRPAEGDPLLGALRLAAADGGPPWPTGAPWLQVIRCR